MTERGRASAPGALMIDDRVFFLRARTRDGVALYESRDRRRKALALRYPDGRISKLTSTARPKRDPELVRLVREWDPRSEAPGPGRKRVR